VQETVSGTPPFSAEHGEKNSAKMTRSPQTDAPPSAKASKRTSERLTTPLAWLLKAITIHAVLLSLLMAAGWWTLRDSSVIGSILGCAVPPALMTELDIPPTPTTPAKLTYDAIVAWQQAYIHRLLEHTAELTADRRALREICG